MAHVDWLISGPKIAACNCAHGCPCEFNAPPTHGVCEGLEAHRIEEGWFGDLRLDGLVVAARYRWPGPVHEGGGVVQAIVDVRADPAQRAALLAILGGKEQEPTTVFNVYGSTVAEEHEPLFLPIEMACDPAAGTGSLRVAGVLEMVAEPIRNPVTGAPHRARVILPEGFEWREAEMASGRLWSAAPIAFDHRARYAFLTRVAYGPYGIVERGSA
jgi:hypothetical protein